MSEMDMELDFIDLIEEDDGKTPEEVMMLLNEMTIRLENPLIEAMDEWRTKEAANPETAPYIPDAIAMSIATWIATESTISLGPQVGPQHRFFAGLILGVVEEHLAKIMYDGNMEEELLERNAAAD